MKLSFFGISHDNCPVEIREKLSFSEDDQLRVLEYLKNSHQLAEALLLNTCNRTEFYLYCPKNFDSNIIIEKLFEEFKPGLFDLWKQYENSCFDRDAVNNLFSVAAGLNSQMPGENQIVSQLKSAYSNSLDNDLSRFFFHRLMHYAFRVAKDVRTNTDINCGAVSLSLAAVELARKKIPLTGAKVIVIGAGNNSRLLCRYLLKAGVKELVIANRNIDNAVELSRILGKAKAISLNTIPGMLADVDLLISSTSSDSPILLKDQVSHFIKQRNPDQPLIMIDIAVPRDIDPNIDQLENVMLYNIDDLNEMIEQNKQKREKEFPKAKEIVENHVQSFSYWINSLDLVPVISKLNDELDRIAYAEAKRYAKGFTGLDEQQLEKFARSLAKKLLHGPITFLKNPENEAMTSDQMNAADMINKMFLDRNGGKTRK